MCALKVFFDTPFSSATVVDLIDTATTDGITATYATPNKTVDRDGATLQFSTIQKRLYDGGFTKASGSITLNTIPPASLQMVIPGIQALLVNNSYDQANVNGGTNTNISAVPFWVGDIDEINIYAYVPQPSIAGIKLTLVNNITSVSQPTLSWVQLACADASGNALTYAATGVSIYTDQIKGLSTIAASSISGSNTLLVTAATGTNYFIAGDYVFINFGNGTQEISQISSISYNLLTMAASFNYSHYVNETVYTCARKFWLKETVPINATANTAANYYNISLNTQCDSIQRP